MAVYRTVYNTFWTDANIMDDFTPEDRYFYLYIMTNPHVNIVGCFEISKKQMAAELGYSRETVESLVDRFERVHGRIAYDNKTKELLIKNWSKYNWTESPKVMSAVREYTNKVKSDIFREYLQREINGECPDDIVDTLLDESRANENKYHTVSEKQDTLSEKQDTLSKSTDILEQRTVTENSNREQRTDICGDIVTMYNNNCVSLPVCKKLSDGRRRKIRARLKTYDLDDFRNAFIKAEASDFMTGRSGNWRANIDWFIENDNNMRKTLEGNYDNRGSSKISPFEKAYYDIVEDANAGDCNKRFESGG